MLQNTIFLLLPPVISAEKIFKNPAKESAWKRTETWNENVQRALNSWTRRQSWRSTPKLIKTSFRFFFCSVNQWSWIVEDENHKAGRPKKIRRNTKESPVFSIEPSKREIPRRQNWDPILSPTQNRKICVGKTSSETKQIKTPTWFVSKNIYF